MRAFSYSRPAACIVFALCGFMFAGCGDSRPARVPVSGTVLIDGAPLKMGSVMFIHPDSRPSAGMIDGSGNFRLTNSLDPNLSQRVYLLQVP